MAPLLAKALSVVTCMHCTITALARMQGCRSRQNQACPSNVQYGSVLQGRRGGAHHLAAEAGRAILAEGGNAWRRWSRWPPAIAVVYPHMNAVGGDGFWLVRERGGRMRGIEACGPAAAAATIAALPRARVRRSRPARARCRDHRGGRDRRLGSSPWNCRGRWAARMPLSTCSHAAIAPGAARARASAVAGQRPCPWSSTTSKNAPGFAATYPRGGQKIPEAGDIGASRGWPPRSSTSPCRPRRFLRGDVGREIAADLEPLGAPVRASRPQALRGPHGQAADLRAPGPRSTTSRRRPRGSPSLMILGIFSRLGVRTRRGLRAYPWPVEATKRAFRVRDRGGDRSRLLDDPKRVLLTRARLDEAARDDPEGRRCPLAWGEGDTVWMGAIDASGHGRVLHPVDLLGVRLGLRCRAPACCCRTGASRSRSIQGALNPLEPGRRPFHTLNPALAAFDDGRVMAYGSMGGDGQPQFQAAIFTRHGFGMGPWEAVDAPRSVGCWGRHGARRARASSSRTASIPSWSARWNGPGTSSRSPKASQRHARPRRHAGARPARGLGRSPRTTPGRTAARPASDDEAARETARQETRHAEADRRSCPRLHALSAGPRGARHERAAVRAHAGGEGHLRRRRLPHRLRAADQARHVRQQDRDSSFVRRFLDAGARFVGKTHTVELAYSLNGKNNHFGTPINPAAPDRVPGGSSSGSAAAVAGRLVDIGLGSDTGGSVRGPASYCGLFGIRPTHGRLPLDATMPLAGSFDTPGWFTRDTGRSSASGRSCSARTPIHCPTGPPAAGRGLFGLAEKGPARVLEAMVKRIDRMLSARGGRDRRRARFRRAVLGVPLAPGREILDLPRRFHTGWRPALGPGIGERFSMAGRSPRRRCRKHSRCARQPPTSRAAGSDGVLMLPTVPGPAPLLKATDDELEATAASHCACSACPACPGSRRSRFPPGHDGGPFGLSLIGPPGSDLSLVRLAGRVAKAGALQIA